MTAPLPAPRDAGPCVGVVGAAAALGVSERTVRRWADDGRLPVAYTTPGGHRRYSLEALRGLAVGAP